MTARLELPSSARCIRGSCGRRHGRDWLAVKYRPHQTVPQLLNLTEAEARERAAELGLIVRVIGPGRKVITADLSHSRVNLLVSLGRVTEAKIY